MKVVLLLLMVFTAQTFANDILDCLAPALDNVTGERADLVAWSENFRETAQRLQSQRQRCNDLPRNDPPTAIQDRMIQACQAAWSASLAFEMNRVITDLVAIDPELAAALRAQVSVCFSGLPDGPEVRRHFMKTINKIVKIMNQ